MRFIAVVIGIRNECRRLNDWRMIQFNRCAMKYQPAGRCQSRRVACWAVQSCRGSVAAALWPRGADVDQEMTTVAVQLPFRREQPLGR
jgi:hypothetical protein